MKQIWYIDFDSTLYNTSELISDTLDAIATCICNSNKANKTNVLNELKSTFNRENIYNIYTLCEFFEVKYKLSNNILEETVNNILANGSKYLYDDSKEFLEGLHNQGCSVQLLTKAADRTTIDYQLAKIHGSSLSELFDNIIVTAVPKYTLDLKYENGIFVDDNPQDLHGLWDAGAKKVIRIKRLGNKYSNKPLNNPEIEEYTTLSEILCIKEEV